MGGIAIDVTERIKAEQALRDSEERFRTLAMNAPVAVFIKDLEGRYTLCNPLASQALGRPQGAVGFTDHELLPAAAADNLRQRDLRGDSPPAGPRNTKKSCPLGGLDRYFLSVKFPLRSADGATIGVCGVAVDVTDRKQAQQALRESERRLLLATQTGKVGVWAWDIVANRVSWSESLQAIVGVKPGDAGDDRRWDSSRWCIRTTGRACSKSLQRCLEQDGPLELEFRAVRPDGDSIWLFTNAAVLREDGRPVRMLGATLDITERKRSELALRRERRAVPHPCQPRAGGHLPIRRPGPHASSSTTAGARWPGISPEQARGDGWAGRVHPEDRERVAAGWATAVRAGEPPSRSFASCDPTAQVTWLKGNAVPLRDAAAARRPATSARLPTSPDAKRPRRRFATASGCTGRWASRSTTASGCATPRVAISTPASRS